MNNEIKLIDKTNDKNFIVAVFDFSLRKGTRKNSKSILKSFYVFNTYNLKIDTIEDFIWYHITQKKLYKNDNLHCTLSIYDENQSIRLNLNKRYSIEQNINDYYILLEKITGCKFNVTLKELHEDSNIRFLINEYYNIKKEGVK